MDHSQSMNRLWLTLFVVPCAVSYSWIAESLLSLLRVPIEDSLPPLSLSPPIFTNTAISYHKVIQEFLAGGVRILIGVVGLAWGATAIFFSDCDLDSPYWSNLWWAYSLSILALTVIKVCLMFSHPKLLEAVWCVFIGCRWRVQEIVIEEQQRQWDHKHNIQTVPHSNTSSQFTHSTSRHNYWSVATLDAVTRASRAAIVALAALPIVQFTFIGLSVGIKNTVSQTVECNIVPAATLALTVTASFDATSTVLYIVFVLVCSRHSGTTPKFWGYYSAQQLAES